MNEHDFELDRFQAKHAARYRKFLVVVDDSPECQLAIRFACGRAAHTIGGRLLLFHCVRPGEFQHWMGVADRMREEARAETEALMRAVADEVYRHVGLYSEIVIAEGEAKEELMAVLQQDTDIFVLILGAHPTDDPGPLVRHFTGAVAGRLPCPVVIVPGAMTMERIDAMV
ncbi:MAG: universal stress protein [Alphaproteobacteria bacterium]|nr:MAG: universal stress protein [Alphaproteobacteria bacterium]